MDNVTPQYQRGTWLAQIMDDNGAEAHDIESMATEYAGDTAQAMLDYARRMTDDGR